ncbi:cytochrome P450 4C1-like [Spodoptera frugiperda]|uniref:Cytochrome P450 4C1-like n=1 Tax=Spodoptera frugiperda TaxID=7108 RepID=A0A9R0EWX7_SPOFR|nr:cytochrome P450 4C1-like [Spodoptera frugiperda]
MLVLELAVIFSVVFAVWWYIYYWKLPPQSPPVYPGALPIIGHAHELFRHMIGSNELWRYFKKECDYALENEGIISLRVGPHFLYGVTDPKDATFIANTCLEKAYFYKFANDFFGKGLLLSDTPEWKVHRKLLNPAFSQTVMNTYVDEINVQAQYFVKRLTVLAGKGPINIQEFITNYILALLCRTSIGLTPEDQNMIDNDYAEIIDEIEKVYNKRGATVWLYPSFIYNRSALKRREQELVRTVKDILNPIIRKRRSIIKETYYIKNCDEYSQTSVTGKYKPLLDLLIHLADEQDVFTEDEIRVQLNTFVAAANDTTTSLLQYILLALGSHAQVQERLYKEVQEVFKNEDLDKNDLTKLVYTKAVIKEVLRLYPPVPLVARRVHTDIKLPKYTLRAGNTCVLSLYDLNRHSSWGPDVKEFKPERWLNPDTLPENPNTFAGFSIGKRNCIGKEYAMMTLKTSLAHIVRKFHISGDINNLKWTFEALLKPTTPALVTLTLRS